MSDMAGMDAALLRELERTGADTSGITVRETLPSPLRKRGLPPELGQVVLVLQGGGALGAYQVGVYQALHERGIEPDWIIGTSIGAINASLIAGNTVEHRVGRLEEFWGRTRHPSWLELALPWTGPVMANAVTLAGGIPGFFGPNPLAFIGPHVSLGAESAGYYDTRPLARTLTELVDFGLIERGPTRLTVGTANVRTSEMRYFDSRDMALDLRHVMASGALPPAFPAVRIDGDLYWDGGVLSNTPVEAVFDDRPRKTSVVFVVHIWNPSGPEPTTIGEVMNRQKDIQYSSRAISHVARQKQMHRLRHVIAELARRLPEPERDTPEARELASYGCLTRMHVVRLLAKPLEGEDHTKDIDFSTTGIARRRESGYRDTAGLLEAAPWEGQFDPVEGLILHEVCHGTLMTAA